MTSNFGLRIALRLYQIGQFFEDVKAKQVAAKNSLGTIVRTSGLLG